MKLIGKIDICGMSLYATVEIKEPTGKGVTYIPSMRKWKAQRSENGKLQYYGYYNSEFEASEAAKARRNLARDRKAKPAHGPHKPEFSHGVTFDSRVSSWRIKMTIGGARVSLGRYATYGHAVLVRDVVARRAGKHVVVADYSMPLGLISDPVARSYITDRVLPPTADELAEYTRRVDALNLTQTRPTQAIPTSVAPLGIPTLPGIPTLQERLSRIEPEAWQTNRTGRAGRSVFDTLDP